MAVNYGFTSSELEDLQELKDSLEEEYDNLTDAIETTNEETLPDIEGIEKIYKKFYDVYENIIEAVDEVVRLSRGWVAYRVTDYPTSPYPNQGYEIQNACDFTYTGEVKVFPSGWLYSYPYYYADYGFSTYAGETAGMNEWVLLTIEETELNRIATFTAREITLTNPSTNNIIALAQANAASTAGVLNLNAQLEAMNAQITKINLVVTLINNSGLSLSVFLAALNEFKTTTEADIDEVERIIADPYSHTLASRKTRITTRRSHINEFLSDITNTSAAVLFEPRKLWMDCRINRSYGSLRRVYSTHISLETLGYRKTMIEQILAQIDTVI